MRKDKAVSSITPIALTVRRADVTRAICVKDLCAPIAYAKCAAAIFVLARVVDNMKNTKKITLCGMVASLSIVIMLTSYFPYLTYAIPALAGIFMMVPLIECGVSWSIGTYVASSAIIFITGETEAKILYILFLGYYPILKSLIERLRKQVIEWVLKFVCFNIAAVVFYYVSSMLFAVSFDDFGDFGKYGALIFLAVCNVVFVLYDIGISRVASYYMYALHDKVKRIIK